MYSDYGSLGVDCRMLADLRQYQMLQHTAAMTSDWLRVLPTSRSPLTGDWREMGLQKWRSTPVMPVTEMTQLKPLNLNVVGEKTARSLPYWHQRRPDPSDGGGGGGQGPKTRAAAAGDRGPATTERRRMASNPWRRFDFRRLAESATRRDDSSSGASDAEITPSAVKVVIKIFLNETVQSCQWSKNTSKAIFV